MSQLSFTLRRLNREGTRKIQTFSALTIDACRVGVIISDMWDVHWCKGASERTAALAEPMERLLQALRGSGAVIAHCPSRVASSFYANTSARKNTLAYPNDKPEEMPDIRRHLERIPPVASLIDPHRRQCDCRPDKCEDLHPRPWTRQIDTLSICDNDFMCDDSVGGEDEFRILNAFSALQITHVLIMGVHTNLCVIHRNFGVRRLLLSGFTPIFVRDMTDCMVPREEKPYHDHFTALSDVIDYIEEYLCASIGSSQITGREDFHFASDQRRSPVFGKPGPDAIPFDDREAYDSLCLALPDQITLDEETSRITGLSIGYGNARLPFHGKPAGKKHIFPLRFGEYIKGVSGRLSAEGTFSRLFFDTSLGRRLGRASCEALGEDFCFEIPKGFALSCLYGHAAENDSVLSGLGFHTRNVSLFCLRPVGRDAAPSNVIPLCDNERKPFQAQWINGRFLVKSEGADLPLESDWLPCLSPSGELLSAGMDGRYFFLNGKEDQPLEEISVLSSDGVPCVLSLFLGY